VQIKGKKSSIQLFLRAASVSGRREEDGSFS
jgi:hypothetical protein